LLTTVYVVKYKHSFVNSMKATAQKTETNKALGMCIVKITLSNNNTLH